MDGVEILSEISSEGPVAGGSGQQEGRRRQLGEDDCAILAEQKPDAVYFYADDGKRTGLLVVNMKDTSQIPAIAEPWFLAFNASVEFHPVMSPEDLAKAGPAIAKAAKNYG